MKTVMNIAIDGPAGAGKSTIAKRIAKEMSYIYVDTGAMYRAMAIYLLRCGITTEMAGEEKGCISKEFEVAVSEKCKDAKITIEYQNGEQIVLLDGENVNGLLRTEEVSRMASISSTVKAVREKLVELQQELAKTTSVVMDGRDICTVVLPDAQVKVYLTASVEERARRRCNEYREKGIEADQKQIEAEIAERDHRDMTRENSPLRQAEDAVLVDSTNMTIDEVVETIMQLARAQA